MKKEKLYLSETQNQNQQVSNLLFSNSALQTIRKRKGGRKNDEQETEHIEGQSKENLPIPRA